MISHFEVVAAQPNKPKREAPKMGWLDRFILAVSPSRALRREIDRNRLDRMRSLGQSYRRGFEAVGGDRLRFDFLSSSQNADSFIAQGGVEAVRQQVRYQEFQTGFVSGPISRIVNNVVGSGFQFQARVRSTDTLQISDSSAERLNRSIERSRSIYARQADQRLIHAEWMLTRLVEGALVRDGEVLVIGRKSGRQDRHIPYCQQVCEIDRLKTPPSEIGNNRIRNGIEYDAEGVPVRFYILKYHPGDSIGIGYKPDDYEQVDAFFPNGTRKVLYLFNPIRPEQLRGFSKFGSALKDLQDLDRYREAEIMAALEDACLTGIVESDAANQWLDSASSSGSEETNYQRIHEFAPNQIRYLYPGEKFTMHGPTRPNTALGAMIEQLLSGPANALDIPPEVLSQNWHGLNYSNARTILLQLYMVCKIRQKYLVDYYLDPTYECVFSDMVAMGHVQARDYYSRKIDYLAHQWIAPGWQWVDPEKEANGAISEMSANIETLPRIWARKGEDWEEQLESQARVLRKMKELEERHDIKFSVAKGTEPVASDEPETAGKEPVKPKRMEIVK